MQPVMTRDAHPTTTTTSVQLAAIRKTLPLRVLSEEDWHHWTTRGYVIVRQAVPAENVERLVNLLWAFDEKDPTDASTWYAPQRREHTMKEFNNTGMLEIYNHQSLWDNRQHDHPHRTNLNVPVTVPEESGPTLLCVGHGSRGAIPQRSPWLQ